MELGNVTMKCLTCSGPHFRKNCPNKGEYEKKKIKIKVKEKKLSFPIKIALHSLKPLLLNCPALSVKVLDKLSCRVIEKAVVVWSS